MNLNTIAEVKRPRTLDEVQGWRAGNAWLGGGTWLFSEPQVHTDTLIDLETLDWPALREDETGLEIAATCRIAELYALEREERWAASLLIGECCRSFLSSFKIWNEATVGGNIVMSLPAGPMISLTVALQSEYELWPRSGAPRRIPAADFVTGVHANALAAGELLRAIHVPSAALRKRHAFRRASLTHLGRSSVLLIGTLGDEGVLLAITAATVRPIQLRFANAPAVQELHAAIDAAIPAELYLDDVHGSPEHRRHLTYHFAREICEELFAS
ncbi:MAG TPA: FAD binding domain-containing protein [Candidatus Cybelea sp.]|jgi:CO/xanthine dehydrogenase FAD-binding subunit|nr:FAD binding domain-containing protein [Candidatus Cybelea sp.]